MSSSRISSRFRAPRSSSSRSAGVSAHFPVFDVCKCLCSRRQARNSFHSVERPDDTLRSSNNSSYFVWIFDTSGFNFAIFASVAGNAVETPFTVGALNSSRPAGTPQLKPSFSTLTLTDFLDFCVICPGDKSAGFEPSDANFRSTTFVLTLSRTTSLIKVFVITCESGLMTFSTIFSFSTTRTCVMLLDFRTCVAK